MWTLLRSVFSDAAIVVYTAFFGTLAILFFWIRAVPGWCALGWARLILWTSGITVIVRGQENISRDVPYVFMSNHASHLDVPSIFCHLSSRTRFLAKRELKNIPIFGWAVHMMGNIYIDRGNRPEAFKTIEEAARKVRQGVPVLVFAEGTRSPDGSLQPFKKGGFVLAIKAGVDIVPISVWGSRGILPKGNLLVRPGTVAIVIGRPISTTGYTLETKEGLMEKIRGAIEDGLITAKGLLNP